MEIQSVVHDTFVLERSYPKPPETVFAAFSDPAKRRRWFAEGTHHELEEYTLDFRVGGSERALSRFKEGSPFPGVVLLMEAGFQDIVANRRIASASSMALGGHVFSAALATFEFVATEAGTDLVFTFQAAFFEGSDGPAMRKEGWEKLLEKLELVLAN
jgi:uncharacterized protein YndB with AHSA1/START domain